MQAEEARRLSMILARVQTPGMSRELALVQLRALYTDARFCWTETHGLAVFWPERVRKTPPLALVQSAGFVEDIMTGHVLKDRVGGTGSMAEELVEDLDVIRVMAS